MKIEELKRGTQIWVRGYVDGVGNIDFLDRERNIDELECLIKDDIYYMSDSDFRLDEPELDQPKPVVPQFVADWVNNSREADYEFDEWFYYGNQPSVVYDWVNSENKRQSELNALALMTLIVNGPDAVTVEKEQLYTVEIPNPHAKGHNKIYLCKDGNTGKVYLCKGNFNPKKNKNLKLTEAEIRKDFD
ncbi:DUF1642 domain-containing protein, partial [Streptococcus uberis]